MKPNHLFLLIVLVIMGCQASTDPEVGPRADSPATAAVPLAVFSGNFTRWLSGDVADESLGYVAGPERYRISFRPIAGVKKHWYYRWQLPRPLTIDAADTLVLEARLRTTVDGSANPLTEIRLCGSFDVLDSTGRKQHADSVTVFHTVYIHEGWQTLTSKPIRPALDVDGRFVLTGLFVGAQHLNLGQRVELEFAALSVRPASAAEVIEAAQPPQALRNRVVRSFAVQDADFRFGAWGNLWAGGFPWHTYLDAVPRRELELCNLENALEAGLDTIWSPNIHHPAFGSGSPSAASVDDAIRLTRLAAMHGIGSIAMTYLSQYYSPAVPLAECGRAIRETVTKLKSEPGVIAYYAIDEPKPDERTMATWLWTQDAFAEVDPTRPVLACLNTRACIRAYAGTDHAPLLDVYPLTGGVLATTGGDPLELARCVDLAHQQGAKGAWVVPQAFASSFNQSFHGWRAPSPAELRLMTWTSLAHGARGVLWFALHGVGLCHGLSDQEGILGIFGAGFSPVQGFGVEAVALGARIPMLGPALVGTRRDSVAERQFVQMGPVQATWQGGPRWDVIVLCNHDLTAPQTSQLTIPDSLRRGRGILRLATGERLDRAGAESSIFLELAPGDGDLLVISDASGLATAHLEYQQRCAAALLRRLRFRAIEAQANNIPVPATLHEGSDLVTLTEAGHQLDAACAKDLVFQPAQAALRRIQLAVTNAGWQRAQHIAATYPRYDAPAITSMRAWNRQLIRCQGVFVLLRNALYRGKATEVKPLATRGAILAEDLLTRVATDHFSLVDGEALDSLYQSCLALRQP